MPPIKKNRDIKTPSQKQTLHHFFNGASATRSSTSAPATKSRHSKSTNAKQSIRPASHQEIIVIDSDSDDDVVEFVETLNTKKRRLSPKCTNHTSNLDPLLQIQTASASGSSSGSKESAPSIVHKALAVESKDYATSTKPDETSFGAPLLLMPTRLEETTKGLSPSFGSPYLLGPFNSQNSVSSRLDPCASEQSNFVRPLENNTLELDPTIDNWKNGDDEDVEFITEDVYGVEENEISISGCDDGTINRSDKQHDDGLDIWDNDTVNDLFLPLDDDVVTSMSSSKIPVQSSNRPSTLIGPQELTSCDGKRPQRTTHSNAFSFLMTSFKENEVWKEAAIAERTVQQKSKGGRRKAPFYKVLQGMPIAVDAFKYGAIPGVTAYFLTHAHSDHYTNLSSTWKHGPIYCSQGTANLIIHMLSVDKKWVHPLPMDKPTVVPNTDGVTVTLIEANHCPGSCLFFFEGRQTVNAGDSTYKSSFVGTQKTFRYLHCGDFRASPRHILHPAVKDKTIDHVYLDTTYLDPKYTFPPQPLVISACADLAKRLIGAQTAEDPKSTMFSWMSSSGSKGKGKEIAKPLIVVGTYSIGKERIVKAIAHAVNSKVYCDTRKAAILRCQGDSELDALLTSNPREAMIHLVPLGTITSDHLNTYLSRYKGFYTNIIGFRPTGWTFVPAAGSNTLPSISSILTKGSTVRDFKHIDLKVSGNSTSTVQVYPVPYSEHSSFYELTCFAMSFSWVRMIATVNVGSESSRGKMKRWVDRWEAERKKRIEDTIVPYRHPDYW